MYDIQFIMFKNSRTCKDTMIGTVAEQLQGRLRVWVLSQQQGSCKQDAARKPRYIWLLWEG